MNVFLTHKHQALDGKDFSRKGSIDDHIVNLVQLINTNESYFTTSSCSGRTILFEQPSLLNKAVAKVYFHKCLVTC